MLDVPERVVVVVLDVPNDVEDPVVEEGEDEAPELVEDELPDKVALDVPEREVVTDVVVGLEEELLNEVVLDVPKEGVDVPELVEDEEPELIEDELPDKVVLDVPEGEVEEEEEELVAVKEALVLEDGEPPADVDVVDETDGLLLLETELLLLLLVEDDEGDEDDEELKLVDETDRLETDKLVDELLPLAETDELIEEELLLNVLVVVAEPVPGFTAIITLAPLRVFRSVLNFSLHWQVFDTSNIATSH